MIDAEQNKLGDWTLDDGYRSKVVRGRGGNHMAAGSQNAMVTGRGFVRAFRGSLLLAGKKGARALFNTDQNYAGLALNGSVFNARKLMLYIGAGQLSFAGADIAGVSASSTLSLLKKIAGVYAAGALSGPIQAGHAQPSAPTIYAKAVPGPGHITMSGAIAVGVHRVCSITGQVSNVSLPSNVVVFADQSMIVQIPGVDANFQDVWGIDVPKIGYADLGNLQQLPTSAGGEVLESYLAYTRSLGSLSIANTTNLVNAHAAEAITGATNATPIVVTSAAHSRLTGERVIITGVTGNTAANGEWVVTKLSANTYSLNSSVGNGAYVAGGSAGSFGANDIGRRIAFSTFDSYVLEVNSATQVKVADTNGSGGTLTGFSTLTHAIDGITRAVEISYANSQLLFQPLAPTKAIPPPAGQFAGSMTDTFWLDSDGLIYIGEPGYVGSFPPSSARFAMEPAIRYLEAEEGVTLRFGRHSIGALYYVGGSPAIEYQSIRKGVGIEYAQNVGIGFNGRVCAWLGKPTTIGDNLDPDMGYGIDIAEFEDWKVQTADSPVVFGYDGFGQYECWCKGKVVFAKLGPTGKWCAPTDLSDPLPGNIVGAVTVFNALYLSVINGGNYDIYQYDAGTGTVMIVRTDEYRARGLSNDVTVVYVQGRADNVVSRVKVEVVSDWTVADPDALDPLGVLPDDVGTQDFAVREPNVIEAKVHAVVVTMTSQGGDCGVDRIVTGGSTSETIF